jgi:hypothetical protein
MSALAQTIKAEARRKKRMVDAWGNTVRKEGKESV